MQSAYIINDRTGKPYAVVGILPGGTEFYPIAESAVSWASWMTQDFAAKKVTKEQLTVTLDNSMTVEGPMPANRANKPKLDELIKKAKRVPKGESDKEQPEQTEEKSLVPVLSVMDVRLDALEDADWRNAVNFKAKSLLSDSIKSTFAYEVKRTRAAWDPSLAIPGTDRRGGWRCPPGTRYGGQITDRFGRNCGWGVARRLANEISDLGERLENVGDRRRERRVARRNERVARRLVEGGRVERAARAVGNALETPTGRERGPGFVERAAGRLGELLETTAPEKPKRPGRQRRGGNDRGGFIERAAGRLAEALETEDSGKPAPRRPRPAAPQARPARPRQPRRPRQPEGLERGGRGIRPPDERRPNSPMQQQRVFNLNQLNDADLEKEWLDARAQVEEAQDSRERQIAELRLRIVDDELESRGMRQPLAQWNNINNPNPARRQPRRIPVDNVSKTPVPAGAPRPNETLEQYKRRKYNEHQQRVREINDAGGNAGFLTRQEWERFHGPAVEENWNRAQARNAGRGARRAATNAGAARSARRRPPVNAEPDAVQPPQRRQRLPFRPWGHQRGLASQEAAFRKLDQLEREAMLANDLQVREPAVVKLNGKYYVVENADDLGKAVDAGGDKVRRGEVETVPNPFPPSVTPARRRTRAGRVRAMNRDRDRHETNLPRLAGEDGKIVQVPVGNKGINTKEDAIAYRGSLADVPDDFLFDAIDARSESITARNNPNLYAKVKDARMNPAALSDEDKAALARIKQSGKSFVAIRGETITVPTFYLHINDDGSIDGRGYIGKGEDPSAQGRGQHGELVGIELARRAGFAQSAPRVVNKNGQARILLEMGANLAEGQPASYVARGITDERSRMAHFVVNMLLFSGDRHGNNGMYFPGNGALPIDFGRAFENDTGDVTAQKMARYVGRLHMDGDPIDGYKALVRNGSMTKQQAKARLKEDIKEIQDAIQGMLDDGTYDSFADLVPNAEIGHANWLPVSRRKGRLQQRVRLLDSDEFIDAIFP